MKFSYRTKFDSTFFVCALLLIAFGFLMVLNSSFHNGIKLFGDPYYFLKRHLIFASMGFIAMLFFSKYDYTKLQKWIFPLFMLTLVFLALTLIPSIGLRVKGSRRWINLVFFSFQTSELAKYLIIIFLANYYSKHQDFKNSFLKFILIPVLVLLPILLLIIVQPDLSTFALLCAIIFGIIFVAGIKLRHLVYLVLSGAVAISSLLLIAKKGYHSARIRSFLDPWSEPEGAGYQTIQALIAFSYGGIWGVGPGESRQKFLLPEAHNDFIFAIVAEELGLVGIVLVLSLFFVFIYRGIRIALRTDDIFARILVFGIMLIICIHVMFNIGVVLGLLPVTGLSLPFVSYGGTALISFMAFTGIVLSVSRSVK